MAGLNGSIFYIILPGQLFHNETLNSHFSRPFTVSRKTRLNSHLVSRIFISNYYKYIFCYRFYLLYKYSILKSFCIILLIAFFNIFNNKHIYILTHCRKYYYTSFYLSPVYVNTSIKYSTNFFCSFSPEPKFSDVSFLLSFSKFFFAIFIYFIKKSFERLFCSIPSL